ncbi:hypothetical protein [Aliikangiella sp. IMCC44359]|uniref:hypothetical protein n=1 Tax=Aliikangiella sp. IMCC44359 TaxID=3459125 RepID=UPI00403AAA20
MSEINIEMTSPSSTVEQVLNASWTEYYQLINQLAIGYKIASSLKLLNLAHELMNQLSSGLLKSSLLERYLIGGISDPKTLKEFNLDTELLGAMSAFPSFKKILKNAPDGIHKLLKIIPANGPIDGWHFLQFIDEYQNLFTQNGIKQAPLFPATRLLSMKRPDQFVCISPDTDISFYQVFNIKPLKKQDFQKYWDNIILPIQKTKWFKQDLPMEPSQLAIYRSRVCLLERVLSQPDTEFLETQLIASQTFTPLNNTHNPTGISTSPQHQENLQNSVLKTITTEQSSNNIISKNGIDIDQTKASVYQTAKQPKKTTITKRKSASVNKTAATKLMSQYYFANKAKFAKVDMSKKREQIIERLCDGESVEEAFNSVL